ncbi:hypothetical protein CKAH01_04126 [Colletotrichum kahawae]|uniref:Uncharacterized protein n=1 Tax=Colletotrichum kahawae TaxID=34407 RepID=A0AAD9YNG9_COLKA|nr:hypothetical protein CKAH01_04126 [Colletotrichum kahawae]
MAPGNGAHLDEKRIRFPKALPLPSATRYNRVSRIDQTASIALMDCAAAPPSKDAVIPPASWSAGLDQSKTRSPMWNGSMCGLLERFCPLDSCRRPRLATRLFPVRPPPATRD